MARYRPGEVILDDELYPCERADGLGFAKELVLLNTGSCGLCKENVYLDEPYAEITVHIPKDNGSTKAASRTPYHLDCFESVAGIEYTKKVTKERT